MKRGIAITLAASIFLLGLMCSGTVQAGIEEKITVVPGKTVTPREESILSSYAVKALRRIAQAREDIHGKKLKQAKAELKLSLALIETIKASLPTVKVRDYIQVAKKHLSYEGTKEVVQDLIPIYTSLEEIEDVVPVDKSREHINKAKKNLEEGNKEGAKEELKLADESLIYTEIDIPIAHTERNVIAARGFLAKNDLEKADEALKAAENSSRFVAIDMYPLIQAKRSLWHAIRHYADGELQAAKADLRDAKVYLGKAFKSADAKTRAEAERLSKDIDAVEGEVEKGTKEAGQEMNGLYKRFKSLVIGAIGLFQVIGKLPRVY